MVKGEKCPSCCPSGGAIFRLQFNLEQDRSLMTCQNCGYTRTPRERKFNPLKDYDFVTQQATSDEGMGARYATYFHCFNPNGAYAQLQAMHKRIDAWVEAHPERPNGVIFVHGSLNDFPRKQLFAVLDRIRKRQSHAYELASALKLIARDIEKGDRFINDPAEWPATKAELAARAESAE